MNEYILSRLTDDMGCDDESRLAKFANSRAEDESHYILPMDKFDDFCEKYIGSYHEVVSSLDSFDYSDSYFAWDGTYLNSSDDPDDLIYGDLENMIEDAISEDDLETFCYEWGFNLRTLVEAFKDELRDADIDLERDEVKDFLANLTFDDLEGDDYEIRELIEGLPKIPEEE